MAEITLKAAYASVVEDPEEGFLFIGFAEGEDEDEAYVLFRQPVSGGPIWFEVGDEAFGAEDALAKVVRSARRLTIDLRPEFLAKFGFATSVAVDLSRCEDLDEAMAALGEMLGDLLQEA